jgi:hypothetical protein
MDETDGSRISIPSHEKKGEASVPRDFTLLRDGDYDPSLNKTISSLVIHDVGHIVYLDQDQIVQWQINQNYGPFPQGFGPVLSLVGYVESLAKVVLSDAQRGPVQHLLGEGVARLIDNRDPRAAREIISKAQDIVSGPARFRYIIGASGPAIIACIILIAFSTITQFVQFTLQPDVRDVIATVCMGAIGAFLSVLSRSRTIEVDLSAPVLQQYTEGLFRGVVGLMGGILVALAIKANIIAGFIDKLEKGIAVFMLLGLVAGASERIIPGLVRRIEDSILTPQAKQGVEPRPTSE